MVLTDLGYPLTEADIRNLCGHTSLGMRLNQISDGLKDIPVMVEYHSAWSIDALFDAIRAGTAPVVGIDLRLVEGIFAFHAVVVVDVTAEQVRVLDPRYPKGPRQIGLGTFESAWTAAGCEAVIFLPEPMRLAL